MWSWLEMSLEVKSRCCLGLWSPESLTEAGSLSFQVAPWQCGQGSADRGSSPVPSPDALAAAHPHGGQRGAPLCSLGVTDQLLFNGRGAHADQESGGQGRGPSWRLLTTGGDLTQFLTHRLWSVCEGPAQGRPAGH